MTTQELIDYYANLLILQYRDKPKALATVKALAGLALADKIAVELQDAFNLDTAVGKQLDTLGKYVGVTRYGYGFNGEPITLGDTDFRVLMRIAIAGNTSQGSLAEIQLFLATFFPDLILVFDFQNMQMGYFIDTDAGSYDLAQMVVLQNLLPRPMGVQLATTIYIDNITGLYGFRTYDLPGFNVSPMNDYTDYQMDRPWLDYLDGMYTFGSLLTEDGQDTIVQEDGDELYY